MRAVRSEHYSLRLRIVARTAEGTAPGIRLDGDTTIIPVVKEVIIKRLLLVEELHLPITKRTKTGYSTDASVLEELRGAHPVVESLVRATLAP